MEGEIMKKTKIDWCDCTLNPVVGCQRGCEYCYAKKINDRFKFVEDFAKPQFFKRRLKQFYEKTPKTIFINSMSDLAYWKDEWVKEVMKAVEDNPQHIFIGLTKDFRLFSSFPKNFRMGFTLDRNRENFNFDFNNTPFDFLNFEPLLGRITLPPSFGGIKAVIIGAETGNRKGKVIPEKEWVQEIVKVANDSKCKVFMKGSLKELMGNEFRQDEDLWERGGK